MDLPRNKIPHTHCHLRSYAQAVVQIGSIPYGSDRSQRYRSQFHRSPPCLPYQALHLPHCGTEARKHGAGDNGVADIELTDLGDLRDRLDVMVIQSMPGMNLKTGGYPLLYSRHDPAQFLLPALLRGALGKMASMDLNSVCTGTV